MSKHYKHLGFHLRDPGVYGPSRGAVEDVHAALALVFQRRPNGQVLEPVLVEVREGSHGGAEPPPLPLLSSQDDRRIELAVNSLAGTHRSDCIYPPPLADCIRLYTTLLADRIDTPLLADRNKLHTSTSEAVRVQTYTLPSKYSSMCRGAAMRTTWEYRCWLTAMVTISAPKYSPI